MTTPIVAQLPIAVSDRIPYTFGTADARHGASFAPEMYFSHPLDKRAYALGYEAVAGVSEATQQFTGSTIPAPITGPTFFTAQFTGSQIVAEVATAGYVESMVVAL